MSEGTVQPESDLGKANGDWIEVAATILIAFTAILTAWAAFQSAKWHGAEAAHTREAAAAGTASSRQTTIASVQRNVDVGTFLQWLQAVRDDIEAGLVDRASGQYVADPNTLSGFIADRFRPEFRTAFAVWVSSRPLVNNEAAATPFELPQYILAADAEMLHSIEEAESQFHSASEANNRAENYVLLTVLFAIALVLAGIGSKLRRSGTRAFMVGLAFATMLAAGLVMATFPIEI